MTPVPDSRPPVQPLFVKFLLGIALCLLVSTATGQPPRHPKHEADDALALRVRTALNNHPGLSPYKLNLLVNVLDGVVVIGGVVPDEKLGRVIESAAAVDGVVRVKVSVWAMSPGLSDPLSARLESELNPKPRAPSPTPAVALSVPADLPPKHDPRPAASMTNRKPVSPPVAVLQQPVVSVEHTSRSPHVRPPGAEPPEYTPIPATNLPTDPILEQPTATPVRAAPPREPRTGELDAWKRDPRFARLTVEVRNGTAIIGGRAPKHTSAWDLAEEVRNWPTVERVVVGRVEVGR